MEKHQGVFLAYQVPTEGKIISGYYYTGYAFMSVVNDAQFVVIAPTIEALRVVYKQVNGKGALDPQKCQYVTAAANKLIDTTGEKIETKEYVNDFRLYWYMHPESGCCFLEYVNFTSDDGCAHQLGVAEEQTVIECKILLRSIGWSREEIEKMTIDCREPIPF